MENYAKAIALLVNTVFAETKTQSDHNNVAKELARIITDAASDNKLRLGGTKAKAVTKAETKTEVKGKAKAKASEKQPEPAKEEKAETVKQIKLLALTAKDVAQMSIQFVEYSSKCMLMLGSTRAIKDEIKALGGAHWNNARQGWFLTMDTYKKIDSAIKKASKKTA